MHAFCLLVNPRKNWDKLEEIGMDYCGPAELPTSLFKEGNVKSSYRKADLTFLKVDGVSCLNVGIYIDDENCLNSLYCDDYSEFSRTIGKLYDLLSDDLEVRLLDVHY